LGTFRSHCRSRQRVAPRKTLRRLQQKRRRLLRRTHSPLNLTHVYENRRSASFRGPSGSHKTVWWMRDRDLDLHEHGQKALVSYVRGYKEHQCSYIFQVSNLLRIQKCQDCRQSGICGLCLRLIRFYLTRSTISGKQAEDRRNCHVDGTSASASHAVSAMSRINPARKTTCWGKDTWIWKPGQVNALVSMPG
jgi:hypothetical protein